MDVDNDDHLLYSDGSSAHPAMGIATILATLRQEWRLPVFGCLICLILAVSYLLSAPTLYKSTARILVDRSINRYLQTNKIVDEPIFDDAEIGSQVHIVSSESIVVPVVRSMNLAHDSEFVSLPNPSGARSYITELIRIVKQSIGWNDDANATIDPNAIRERTAVEAFIKRLTVVREDVANVINVTFESEDPIKAARIANAVADTYLATSLEAKSRSTKIANQWLQDRLMKLRVQTVDADRALQPFSRLCGKSGGFPCSDV